MAHIYEVNATIDREAKVAFENFLSQGTIEEVLELPGCFFTEARIFERTSDDYEASNEAGKWTVQFVSKSADGIAHYLKHHASRMRQHLAPFRTNGTFQRRVYKLARVATPAPRARLSSEDPTAVHEPKLLGPSKRPVTADAFKGAYGNASAQGEFSTARYTDFKPHRHAVATNFSDSARISKGRDVDVRFFDATRHKAAAHHVKGEQGITSAQEDAANPETRFYHEGKHFGQVNPLRASVVNPDGSHVVAGVTTAQEPHEIDRFENVREHHGHINPLRASVVGPDGSSVVAGVTTAQEPHEIDRFENVREHHGHINPLRASVVGPDGSSVVAGVTTAQEPHEIDRFEGVHQHHGHINPNRASVVSPDGSTAVAGVTTAQEPHEIDRFEGVHQHHGHINPNRGSVVSPDGSTAVAGVPTAKEPHENDRFVGQRRHFGGHTTEIREAMTHTIAPGAEPENDPAPFQPKSRPQLHARQAPGGNSTLTFG